MSRVNSDELPGSMVVLGLLIEKPGASVKEIGQEVRQRFKHARFADTTAHSALPRLAERRGGKVPCADLIFKASGRARSQDCYEPNEHGEKVFRAWMYDEILGDEGGTIGKPSLREAMLGRIELAQLKDLPRLIEMAHLEVKVSTDLFAYATMRLRDHLGTRTDPLDFLRKVREVLLYVDGPHWSSRAERYRVIAHRLEDIKEEAEAAGVKFYG